MTEPKPKVLYFNHAGSDLYDLIREKLADDFELLTLTVGDEDERLALLADTDAIIVGSHKLERHHVDQAPRLRFVQHQGVGYHDTVPVDALRNRQIALAIAPGGAAIGVADHAILLMLATCKRLPYLDSELKQGRWRSNDLRMESRQLTGMTVGIIGLGRIGKAVAQRLAAFETTTLYHDILDMPAEIEARFRVERTDFADLIARSDLITLHVPLTADTHHMIDAAVLGAMKPGTILINCARGPVVEESALLAALGSDHLGGAGLDVFEIEPPLQPTPFAAFHNVVLTPHMAPGTREGMAAKMQDVCANIDRFFRGEALVDAVRLADN